MASAAAAAGTGAHLAAVNTTASIATTTTTTASLASVLPDPYLLSLFTIGAFVMRGAGCTINDWWDQDYDKHVQRTASRPLASGQVSSTQALQWLAVQLSLGCAVLVSLTTPAVPHTMLYTFQWGVASLPLVLIYPLMKRYTHYPQLVLGLTFNWGCWMGWAATFGDMNYSVILPLYVSGIAWTMVYDTIYANQDREDDAAIGLHSTALTFGGTGANDNAGAATTIGDDDRQRRILHAFAALAYASWLLSGYNLYIGGEGGSGLGDATATAAMGVYGAGATAAYSHLIWQIRTADFNDPHNLAERFRSNSQVGGIIFVSIVGGNVAAAATTASTLLVG